MTRQTASRRQWMPARKLISSPRPEPAASHLHSRSSAHEQPGVRGGRMQGLSPTYYIVFTAVTAAGVLLQALVLLAIYFAIKRSSGKLQETLDEVKSKALPAIESARSLLEDVSPKLKSATGNLLEVSGTLRQQSVHVNMTVESLLEKTNAQITRVDEMVT